MAADLVIRGRLPSGAASPCPMLPSQRFRGCRAATARPGSGYDRRAMPEPPPADASGSTTAASPSPPALSPDALRWRCPDDWLAFETTAEIEPGRGIRGQPIALGALRFGLATRAPNHHVFVRGLAGTGRAGLLGEVMDELRPRCDLVQDHCYVHRFGEPARPRLITLPRGTARDFARAVDGLARSIVRDLPRELAAGALRSRREAIARAGDARFDERLAPFEKSVASSGCALVTVGEGPGATPAVFPVVDGEPAPPEALRRERAEGRLGDADYEAARETLARLQAELDGLLPELQAIREETAREIRAMNAEEIRRRLRLATDRIHRAHPTDAVRAFLDELIEAVAEHGPPPVTGETAPPDPGAPDEDVPLPAVFRVNVVRHHGDDEGCPIVIDSAPSQAGIFGSFETTGEGPMLPHAIIRGGSLLEADGGFLVIEARDLLAAGRAWPVLARTLRSRVLEIEPPGEQPSPASGIKPDPIPVTAKVVLVGDAGVYALLEAADPDFTQLFKVVADFGDTMKRGPEAAEVYAGAIARIAAEEDLAPFGRDAVAALLEHGARVAADDARLTARLGRICDVAREAAFLAAAAGRSPVAAADVHDAIARGRERASRPVRRFHELLADGTIAVATDGMAVGQVNGLATMTTGPLTYGFPQRITASVGPGSLGLVNVEQESDLSGAIHTKGFHILRGLLHHLLRLERPLALDASIVFEQSYGGVDGDSASAAEACCLISALTDLPLRQDLAITGAIDQRGAIMAVGAVTEKIDGFHDACAGRGLTGTQGVIIPRANVGDLALRPDVVEACRTGRFRVHAVSRIEEALALLTGRAVAVSRPGEDPPEDGLLGRARAEALRLWQASARATVGSTVAATPPPRIIAGDDAQAARDETASPPPSRTD